MRARSDLERLFGPSPGSDGELARLVRSQPDAKVIVYYSGHGATNSSHSETYLLPVDAEPYREELGGYPLSTLYANLAALKAKSVLVLLESEYGRDHGDFVLAAQSARDDEDGAAASAAFHGDRAVRLRPRPARDSSIRPMTSACSPAM